MASVSVLIIVANPEVFGIKVPPRTKIAEARKVKERLELEHFNDPKDAKSLAIEILSKAFSKSTNDLNSLNGMELMRRLSSVPASTRFYVVRIFDLMDTNHDEIITNTEYVKMYAEPTSSIAKSFEMMHRLCDLNDDGFITKWELFTALLAEGNKVPLLDLWNEAIYNLSEIDTDRNGLGSRDEFMATLVYQVQYGTLHENKYAILQGNL